MTTISPRFSERVFTHLVTNVMKHPTPATPLILAIHGEPGTGKSFQLDQTLREMGVHYKTISSSELESANANDPAKLVRATYLEVADEVSKKGLVSGAIVVNDIDSALGDWGPLVQTTVNRQMVIGELQHITDYPEKVDNRRNQRIPIFVTANDVTKLYGPLVRPGRTDSFYWAPTAEEIANVVQDALPHLTEYQVRAFVTRIASTSIVEHLNIVRSATARNIGKISGSSRDVLTRARKGELDFEVRPTLDDLYATHDLLSAERDRHQDYTRRAPWQEPTPTLEPIHEHKRSVSTLMERFATWGGRRVRGQGSSRSVSRQRTDM
ncbi:AAA family ATPase [Humibacter ginsengiterrae]